MEEYTEYTEYTEPEMENSTDYTEESAPDTSGEIPEGNTDESGTQPEAPGDISPEAETENNDSGNADVITDTENNVSDVAGDDTGPGDFDAADVNLLERVETLLDALAPETDGENGANESDENAEPEISEYDTQTLETLQSINVTLSAMRTESEAWHTETLKHRDETKEAQQYISSLLEMNALLLIGAGFFIALLCGGKFADIFFKRMREKE